MHAQESRKHAGSVSGGAFRLQLGARPGQPTAPGARDMRTRHAAAASHCEQRTWANSTTLQVAGRVARTQHARRLHARASVEEACGERAGGRVPYAVGGAPKATPARHAPTAGCRGQPLRAAQAARAPPRWRAPGPAGNHICSAPPGARLLCGPRRQPHRTSGPRLACTEPQRLSPCGLGAPRSRPLPLEPASGKLPAGRRGSELRGGCEPAPLPLSLQSSTCELRLQCEA
jgi:hypothetical protein